MEKEDLFKDELDYRFNDFLKLITENKNSKLVYLMSYYFEVINGIINLNNVPEEIIEKLAFINKSINDLLNNEDIFNEDNLENFKNLCDLRYKEYHDLLYTEEKFKADLKALYEELLLMHKNGLINGKEDIANNIKNIILEDKYGY